MSWKDYIIPPAFQQKATDWHRAVVKMLGLTPQYSERNYENFAKEGYNANVWTFRCIQAIAENAASVSWLVYQYDSQGNKKEILVHDILKLLNKPNEFMSRSELFEAYTAFALIAGNSYLHVVRPSSISTPKELWPLRPDRVKVVPDATNFIGGYTYTVGDQVTKYDRTEVSHLKSFNPISDFYGLSRVEVAARGIDNDNAANAHNNSLLTNGARPGGALVTENTLSEPQYEALKEELDKKYRGTKNAGKPMILEGGLKWQEMSLSPRDLEFINSKKMSILEICAAFGVPPEIVGYGEHKTYSNYQEARKALYVDAVLPMLNRIRDKLNADIVPAFGDNLYLDYNKDEIEALQENRDAVYKRATDAYFKQVLTKDEAREEIGYGPESDANGEFYVPPVKVDPLKDPKTDEEEGKKGHFFNVKSLNIETEEEKTMFWKAQEKGRENFYDRAIKAVQKQFEIERKAVLAAYKNNKDIDKAIDQKAWQKLYTGIYVEIMQYFGDSLFNQFKKDADVHLETKAPLIPLEKIFNVFDKAVQRFIASTVAGKVVKVTDVTKRKIRGIIKTSEAAGESIEQIAKKLDDLYLDQIIPNRSEVIARTEVIGASNAGNSYAADQTGLKLNKEWLTTRDGRERDTHADIDGEKVKKETRYSNGLMFPGDPDGEAGEVIQCRCTEIYSVIK